ncbi:MAG: hypothetical protein GY738_29990 [Pseudoalteromonas sp.]|nr:hypothetical protein [Pseudoalteromonas sp.]
MNVRNIVQTPEKRRGAQVLKMFEERYFYAYQKEETTKKTSRKTLCTTKR